MNINETSVTHMNADVPPESFPHVILGRYELCEKLGEGAFGCVYRAVDLKLNRPVAVKMLKTKQDEAEALRRESVRIAQLTHPNICPIYDAGYSEQNSYIVMPHLKGGTLADRLKQAETTPRERTLRIVYQIASALSAAHGHSIIHRDLKPGNILFDATTDRLMVMDFGISRVLGHAPSTVDVADDAHWPRESPHQQPTDDESRSTCVRRMWGTPRYMSPEQICGDTGNIGPATDVYSLGVILFRLLSGRVPFTGSEREVLHDHCVAAPAAPSSFHPEVGPRLDALCLKALAKEPSNRPSAAALMHEVWKCLEDEYPQDSCEDTTPTATPVEPMDTGSKPTRPTTPSYLSYNTEHGAFFVAAHGVIRPTDEAVTERHATLEHASRCLTDMLVRESCRYGMRDLVLVVLDACRTQKPPTPTKSGGEPLVIRLANLIESNQLHRSLNRTVLMPSGQRCRAATPRTVAKLTIAFMVQLIYAAINQQESEDNPLASRSDVICFLDTLFDFRNDDKSFRIVRDAAQAMQGMGECGDDE